jgi:hypothetical protein
MNKETAIAQARLNAVDQVGPYGSTKYTESTNGSPERWDEDGTYHAAVNDGTPKFTQTVTLSPEQQAIYDSQNKISQQALNLGQGAVGNVQNAISKPFDTSNAPGQIFGVDAGPVRTGVGDYGGYQSSIPGQTYNGNVNAPQLQSWIDRQHFAPNIDPAGKIQGNISGSGDYGANVKSVQDALMARLNPQIEQDRTRLETRLANQGITAGSEAYDRAINLGEQGVNDQRTQALLAASGEQSRLAGLDLAAGNFANSAQAQGFGQGATRAQFANNALAQQMAGDKMAGDFRNDALTRTFGMEQSALNTANDAKSRQFATDAAGADFSNNVTRQRLTDALSQADLYNAGQSQAFGQGVTNANLQNSGRANAISEAAYMRSQPINELAALMGFSPGVQVPNFQNNTATGIAPPDYQGAVQSNYQGQQNVYNQKMQANSALLGDIFGLAGAAGGAWIGSDRRLKDSIRRVGTAANGLPIYSYRYKSGGPLQIGFMADEVEKVKPWAVIERDGFKMVNYSLAAA